MQNGQWTKHHREIDIPTGSRFPSLRMASMCTMPPTRLWLWSFIKAQGMRMATTKASLPLTMPTGSVIKSLIPLRYHTSPLRSKKSLTCGWCSQLRTNLSRTQPSKLPSPCAKSPKRHSKFSPSSSATSPSSAKRYRIGSQGDSIMLFQEAHLQKGGLDNTMQYFTTSGCSWQRGIHWRVHRSPSNTAPHPPCL